MSGTQEHAGFCAHCRTVYRWQSNKVALCDAACPNAGCGLPLVRRPRANNIGRHAVEDRHPITRERQAPAPQQENATDGQA